MFPISLDAGLRVLFFSIIEQNEHYLTAIKMKSLLTGVLIKVAISITLYFLAFLPMGHLPDLLINNDFSSFFYLPTGI